MADPALMRIDLNIVRPMAMTAEEFAQSAIDRVHALWLGSRDKYPAGYAVFYGPARLRPDLMVIGLNPGGDATCFSGNKESIVSVASPMEYITYKNDRSYPLAGKTVSLFEAIGLLNTLRCSLKTNLNFFRSKKFSDLPQSHASECLQLVLEMITFFRPQVILCESMRVFDILHAKLAMENSSAISRLERDHRGWRIYTSVATAPSDDSAVLIGIKHLTGSRPSSTDIAKIQRSLADELGRTIASSRRSSVRG